MKKFNVAILGTGIIANKMAETLNGMDRNRVNCYAVASRTLNHAIDFAKKNKFEKSFGSYEDLVMDSAVDLVYIATPHSEHYNNARLCIEHGKACLVEKAFTINEKQAASLFELADSKKVFITEAIWTRYMPFADKIREVLASGCIGKPAMLTANLGYKLDHIPRMQRPELAGGSLLDIGVYTLNFASMFFGDDIEKVVSTCTYTKTGMDEQDSITLIYKDGRMAVLNSSMLSLSDRFGFIHGEKGFLQVENINNFQSLVVRNQEGAIFGKYKCEPQITGYEYEVYACLDALEAGKLECDQMPHKETLRIMRLMDSLRHDWGIVYPMEK